MPVLRSVKEERFASSVAEGMTRAEAYKSAGYIGKDPQLRADNLCRKKEVKGRIKELTARISKRAVDRAAKKLHLTKEMVLAELWDNAQKGATVKGGSSVRNRALELIGKELGMFKDGEPEKPLDMENLTAEQLRQLLGPELAAEADIDPTDPRNLQ